MSSETRFVRKNILAQPQQFDLRCPREFTEEAAREAVRILANPLQPYRFKPLVQAASNGVSVQNIHFRQIYELLFGARCVRDLFWLLSEKRCGSYGELKRALESVPWNVILPAAANVRVKARSTGSRLFHEGGIVLAASEFLEKKGMKAAKTESEFTIECNLQNNHLRILLGCLGRPANERGYKKRLQAIAPLKSELAACLFERLRKAAPEAPLANSLIVPFAGSGTLAVEGILAMGEIPAGIFGREFAYERFLCVSAASNAAVRERYAKRRQKLNLEHLILIESDPAQQVALQENVLSALGALHSFVSLDHPPVFLSADYRGCALTEVRGRSGFLLPFNPPYGERLGNSPETSYRELGVWLSERGISSSSGFILSPSEAVERNFKRWSKCQAMESVPLRNGGMRIRALNFAL